MKNKMFVSGATGFQGSKIAGLLIEMGNQVVSLQPPSNGFQETTDQLELIEGSLEDEKPVCKALRDVEAVVFTFPLLFDIHKAEKITNTLIKAAKLNGVSRIIFNSSFHLPRVATGFVALDIKLKIYELLKKSGLEVITVIPDIYLDNLSAPWSIPVIMEKGILPYPIGSNTKVPWISHMDMARFVCSAIDKPELAGSTLSIGGNLYSGEEIADAISEQLKRHVQFVSLTPDDFEKQLIPAFGTLAAREISNLYRYVAKENKQLVEKDFQVAQDVLSVNPKSLAEWVSSVNWKI